MNPISDTPHFYKIWHPLRLPRDPFRGDFLTKILYAFLSPSCMLTSTLIQPLQCTVVNRKSCATCVILLLHPRSNVQIFSSVFWFQPHLQVCPSIRTTYKISNQYKRGRLEVTYRCQFSDRLQAELQSGAENCPFYSVQAVTRAYTISHRVGPGLSSDHSSPSGTDARNTWSNTSDMP